MAPHEIAHTVGRDSTAIVCSCGWTNTVPHRVDPSGKPIAPTLKELAAIGARHQRRRRA